MRSIESEAQISGAARRAPEDLLRLLLDSEGQRISSAPLGGRVVWIKRYDVDARPWGKRLHARLSRLLPEAFHASPPVGAAQMVDRELRKMEAFRAAGFGVPEVIYRRESVIVMSHMRGTVQGVLDVRKVDDPEAHDSLLVEAARALGQVHSAGLCHGRPHPRDMFLSEGSWGFVDFEEEPEAVMPLRVAQARDLWLLFLQVSGQSVLQDTEHRALAAYLAAGPAGVLCHLQRIVRYFTPLLPSLCLLDGRWLGADGHRLYKATRFLRRALRRIGEDMPPSMDNSVRLMQPTD